MKLVNEDISESINLIKTTDDDFLGSVKYESPFLFSTESQEAVSTVLDYNNKDVLTVAASGDQYLGAMYYGAKKVDLFDINRFSYYIAYLKIAAVRSLSYQEFMKFFVPYSNNKLNKKFFDLRTLKKLLPLLPSDVGLFWDKVMYEVRKRGYGNFLVLDFCTNHLEVIKRGMPFYSNEEEYCRLQSILRKNGNPKFSEVDLLKLSDVIVDKYDVVYLSNIIEVLVMEEIMSYPWMMQSYGLEDRVEIEKLEVIGEHLFKVLKDDAIALMDYRTNAGLESSSDLLFNNDFFVATNVLNKIPSYLSNKQRPEEVDCVLTYKPSKTGKYLQKK